MKNLSVILLLALCVAFVAGRSRRPSEEMIVGTWGNSQDKIRLFKNGSFTLYKLKGKAYRISGKWELETYEKTMRIFAKSKGKNFAIPIESLAENELVVLGMPGVMSKSTYKLNRIPDE